MGPFPLHQLDFPSRFLPVPRALNCVPNCAIFPPPPKESQNLLCFGAAQEGPPLSSPLSSSQRLCFFLLSFKSSFPFFWSPSRDKLLSLSWQVFVPFLSPSSLLLPSYFVLCLTLNRRHVPVLHEVQNQTLPVFSLGSCASACLPPTMDDFPLFPSPPIVA